MADTDYGTGWKELEKWEDYMAIIVVPLSIASVIFGCISWVVLPSWRQFRHYAFINVLFTQAVSIVDFVVELVWPNLDTFLGFVAVVRFYVFTQWLVLITVMFYIEFVKVFTGLESIRWLYLKANIFGWLLPIVCAIVEPFAGLAVFIIRYACLTLFNLIVYVIVLFRLCKTFQCSDGLYTKIVVSIFAFMFTGIVWFLPFMAFMVQEDSPGNYFNRIFSIITVYSYAVIILLLNVFFLMLKSHRTLWTEYWLRKRNNVI